MSLYDQWKTRSGDDEQDALNFSHIPQPNAICSECLRGFVKGREDIGSLCDRCCSLRDALVEWDRTHGPKDSRR